MIGDSDFGVCPRCGGRMQRRSKRCINCRGKHQLNPSIRKCVVLALVNTGDVKGAASLLKMNPKTFEYYLRMIRYELKLQSLYDLINWAWRSGLVYILIGFTLLASAKPHRPHQPPPPSPPPVYYTTNLTLAWNPSTDTNFMVYELIYTNITTGGTNAMLTFGTNEVVTGLSTTNRYNFAVRCAQTNQPSVWSFFTPFVTWSIGQPFTGSFPLTNGSTQ